MRTNYCIWNKVAGFALAMCMMIGFTSCEGTLDDIFGEWDKPAVQQAIETIVTVTGASPSDVTAALKAIVTDETIAAAAAKGEPIKVVISGSGVSAESADQTIVIPQKNGAVVEISFSTAPTTSDDTPLEFTASSGASAASSDSNNDLAIEMPSSSGLVITIELPQTTVTLATNGSGTVTYKSVTAKTATNTLNVEESVIIKDLKVEGGNVVINGGEIQNVTIAENQDVTFTYDGSSTNKMTIGAGASVRFTPSDNEEIYPKIKEVIGDADSKAKFYAPRFKNPPEDEEHAYHFDISGIDKISNCKVLFEGDADGGSYTNVLFDNCEMNAGGIWYTIQRLEWPESNEITFSNCTFNFDGMGFMSPNLNEDHNEATLVFNNCTFKEGIQIYQFGQYANAVINHNYTITFKFVGCKLGDTDISSSNFISSDPEHPGLIQQWALIKDSQYVDDADIGGGYFIHAIYQIGDDKFVWKKTGGTDEEPVMEFVAYTE